VKGQLRLDLTTPSKLDSVGFQAMPPLWVDNLERLSESLLAQLGRIRAGSDHATTKGGSLEAVVRRTLREYLPGYFRVGGGQIANLRHDLSPQLDVMVYDGTAFPHLAVNEDSSVVVCCEALYGAVECKTTWDRARVEEHFKRFADIESGRGEEYLGTSNAAAYYAVVFDEVNIRDNSLEGFADDGRFVGVYTVAGRKCWTSGPEDRTFHQREGNALSLLLGDLLADCMEKGSKDEGSFNRAYAALKPYLG
jgi:hypothetical protein